VLPMTMPTSGFFTWGVSVSLEPAFYRTPCGSG